jgi:hypothetical protein
MGTFTGRSGKERLVDTLPGVIMVKEMLTGEKNGLTIDGRQNNLNL